MNTNKVLIAGNAVRDCELRYLDSGTAVAKISVALNRKYSKDGQQKEEVAFVDVEAWGKVAEALGAARQGQNLVLEGRLKQDMWEDKSGQKRSKLLVVLENFPGFVSRQDAARPAPLDGPKPPTTTGAAEEGDVPF